MKRLICRRLNNSQLILIGLAIMVAVSSASQSAEPQDCHIPGVEDRVKCLTVTVPEDRSDPNGRTIDIAVSIMPSKAGTPKADPFLILAGGPGQAARDFGAFVPLAFKYILEDRDIVLVDRRGTGDSNPLECEFLDSEKISFDLTEITATARQCLANYNADVRHYGSLAFIEDLEAVRSALGVDQWNIWGGSYGTRDGLLYMRAYPERIRTAILDGAIAPETRLFESEPVSSERAFRMLAEDCAEDAACRETFGDLTAMRDRLLTAHEQDKRYRFDDPLTGERKEGVLTRETVAQMIRASLYSPATTRMIPFALQSLEQGDPTVLFAAASPTGSAAGLMALGATLSTLCGEEIARLPADRAARAGRQSFTGYSYYQLWNAGCEAWPAIATPLGYGEPVTANVPTLVLSGAIDPVTPPTTGQVVADSLLQALHIVVPNGGHNVSQMGCIPRLMSDFVDTGSIADIDPACAEQGELPPFVIRASGPGL